MLPLGEGAIVNPLGADGFWREKGFSKSGPRYTLGFGGERLEPSKMLSISPGSAVWSMFGDVDTLSVVGSWKVLGFEDMEKGGTGKMLRGKVEEEKYHGVGIRRSTKT